MPICKPQQLRSLVPQGQRLLALDVSKKTIGLAISDPNWTTALPVTAITRRKLALDLAELQAICRGRAIGGLVIGLPLNMDGSFSARAQSVQTFGHNLLKEPIWQQLPITFWDERLTTHAARDTLQGRTYPPDAADQIAAVLILDDFINNF